MTKRSWQQLADLLIGAVGYPALMLTLSLSLVLAVAGVPEMIRYVQQWPEGPLASLPYWAAYWTPTAAILATVVVHVGIAGYIISLTLRRTLREMPGRPGPRVVLLIAFLVLVGIAATLLAQPAWASTPTIRLKEAHAFENVLESGDLLILVRYELPTSDWRNATYMADATCTNEDDFDDDCWTSLISGTVLHTLYDGSRDTATLRGVETISRIGHAMSGIYLEAGHGLTWGDTSYETCLEGSNTIFTSVPNSCLTLYWHSSSSVAATPDVMEPYIVQMVLNLESSYSKPAGTFVVGDRIVDEGIRFPREAFGQITSVAPDAFFTSATAAGEDFSASATPSALETSLQSTAQSSTVYQQATHVAGEFFGVGIRVWGSMVTLAIAALAVIAVTRLTGSSVMGTMLGAMIVGWGVFMDWIPLEPVWVILAIMLVLGGSVLFRRVPS